jgi:uncharacterized protein YjbJ (UPF0337 family)
MNWNRIQGRYYQIAGRIRECLGTVAKNELEVKLGRQDQIVGRIKEHCGVSLEDAELLASELLFSISHE